MRRSGCAVLVACVLVGCGGSSGGGGPPGGTGPSDAGGTDAGGVDAGPTDGGATDAGQPDAGGGATTVIGQLVDDSQVPVASVPVLISSGSFQASTVTDAAGRFTVSGVPTPYDLRTVVTDSGRTLGMAYLGLRRSDPTIQVFFFRLATRAATVSGRVDGGMLPLADNQTLQIFYGAGTASGGWSVQPDGSYIGQHQWAGPSTVTGTLYALEWTSDSHGLPDAYQRYGARPNVSLADHGSLPAQDIQVSPVASVPISGTLTVPAGSMVTLQSELTFGTWESLSLGYDAAPTSPFSYTFPGIPTARATLLVTVVAPSGGVSAAVWRGSSVETTSVDLHTVTPPAKTAPADGATQVGLTTAFSWSEVPASVYLLGVQDSDSTKSFYIVTARLSETIPDFSSLGLSLPASTAFSWTAFNFAPFADVDAAATPTTLLGLDGTPANPATGEAWYGAAELRYFTSGP